MYYNRRLCDPSQESEEFSAGWSRHDSVTFDLVLRIVPRARRTGLLRRRSEVDQAGVLCNEVSPKARAREFAAEPESGPADTRDLHSGGGRRAGMRFFCLTETATTERALCDHGRAPGEPAPNGAGQR